MKLIIDIHKKDYQSILNSGQVPYGVVCAIMNGTPLPKGHGDLISKEQAIDLVEFYQLNPQHFDFVDLIDEIKDEKPIIEADKGVEVIEKGV